MFVAVNGDILEMAKTAQVEIMFVLESFNFYLVLPRFNIPRFISCVGAVAVINPGLHFKSVKKSML